MLNADTMKLESEVEACCVCSDASEDLFTPEEYDASAPSGDLPLRAVLLHLNHTKAVPSGRLCFPCIRKALDAYHFSATLASRGPPPLSEKIRALRRKLHELTQKIDVFIVVGGGADGAYSEEDIIMVEKEALAAAARSDSQELLRARSMRGDHCYQCTVCPLTFQRASEYRTHVESHGTGATHSCWTCGAQFASHEAARQHHGDHERGADRDRACHHCDTTFQSVIEQRQHEESCPPVCPAPGCGVACESRASLLAHVASHDTVCGVCLRVLPSAAARAAHALAHRQQRQFLCGYDGCILRFATRVNLLSHLRKCHGGEPAESTEPPMITIAAPVPCDNCDRTFATVTAMRRHARVHKTETRVQTVVQKEEPMEWTVEEEADGRIEYLEVETLEDLEGAEALLETLS